MVLRNDPFLGSSDRTKLEGNAEADVRQQKELWKLGWEVIVIWECELKKCDSLTQRIKQAF